MKYNFLIFFVLLSTVLCENKYSRSANEKAPNDKNDLNLRTLEKPFRMNKLNLLWAKAKQRLTDPKLKSFYSDLMIQDKEEITYKRVRSEGGDKEGYKEAELRRKLTTLMDAYNLREHFDDHKPSKGKNYDSDILDNHINKSLFKDKKLNQLWLKAEMSGFTSEELEALKEEFQHHQDKIDQYYDLLSDLDSAKDDGFKNVVNEEEIVQFNEIKKEEDSDASENEFTKDYLHKNNMVREKHRDLRDGYDRLQRMAARGPNSKEFIEPKVQGLWKIAAASNFTVEELASIKVELQHYESRLLKLRQLHADHIINTEKHDLKPAHGDKSDHMQEQQTLIKKHVRKVEKLHEDLESRILARHSEL